MTLTEFLLARIAEDEALAESALHLSNGGHWWVDGPAQNTGKHWIYDVGERFGDRPVADHIAQHNPARVLAECQAKRAIVEWASDGEGEFHWSTVLAPLAAVYADHPDYREEWKP